MATRGRTQRRRGEGGLIVLEFTLTLLMLLFFLSPFFVAGMIFVTHERLSYAAYLGARSYAVNGEIEDVVDDLGGGEPTIPVYGSVNVAETITMPGGLYDWGTTTYAVSATMSVAMEDSYLEDTGDNAE